MSMLTYFVVRCTYGDMDHYHGYEKLAGKAIGYLMVDY